MRACRLLLLATLLPACVPSEAADPRAGGDELPLGDVSADDLKDDGTWGYALTCKPVPSLPQLKNPKITLSLHGLTLHLTDDNGFDKVFPIGPGKVDTDESSLTDGESLSYGPVMRRGTGNFVITPSTIQPCKTWWTDPETGKASPVFAGLPFLSWSGSYAIHGPIDNFRAQNGGNLRRGFVSHGCIRMEAADVLEVYGRIRGVASIPVRVQREPERDGSGRRIDLAARFIGAECASDGDCNFASGFCKKNRWSGRGFCSARCLSTCSDRAGYPTTFCVADPDDATKGMCVSKVVAERPDCRAGDHFVAVQQARFKQPAVRAAVCMAGSPGWVGDHCFSDGECSPGNRCAGAKGGAPGTCTQGCARFCPDQAGWASTFCASAPALGGNSCLRQCTPASNASECPANSDCLQRANPGDSKYLRTVCIPRG